jgi:hypothetical protein
MAVGLETFEAFGFSILFRTNYQFISKKTSPELYIKIGPSK